MSLLYAAGATRRLTARGLVVLGALALCVLASASTEESMSGAVDNSTPPGSTTVGRAFSSSFESVDDFAGFFIEPQNHLGSASHEQSTERARTGAYSHKGWIYSANPSPPGLSHRAYPTVQFHTMPGGSYVCPCTVRLHVWLDVLLDEPGEWFSFVTLARNPSNANWDAVTVNIAAPNPAPGTAAGGVMHLMHVPTAGLREPTFQSGTITFPMREWVEILMYFDMDPLNGQAAVWQDGQLVSVAPIRGGTGKLEQAHFGLYAAASVASGVVFNDDLEIVESASSPDTDGDGAGDVADNCPAASNSAQTDSDGDGLGDVCEASSGTNVADPDTDDDGCADGREVRVLTFTPRQGGSRDPVMPADFFDVPVPALTALNPGGVRNRAIGLTDALAILFYVGAVNNGPPNGNGIDYDTDLNGNGTEDGSEYDRAASVTISAPWRSGAGNGAVTLSDVLVALSQAGHSCAGSS